MKLRISPSTLENFRVCRLGLFNKTDLDFIADLKRERQKTEAMSLGSAFHAIIENGDVYPAPELDPGSQLVFEPELGVTWLFKKAAVLRALVYRREYSPLIHEIPGQLITQIENYEVVSNLRIDGAQGLLLHEVKTTSSTFPIDREKFYDSVQWRMYCLVTGAFAVKYTIFKVEKSKTNARIIEDMKPDSFEFYAEVRDKSYVDNWMKELIFFLEKRGLLHLVELKN